MSHHDVPRDPDLSLDETSAEAAAPTDPASTSGRHPVDVGHLVMGVAFLGLAVVWLLVTVGTVDLSESRWLLPLPWLVAGAVGLLAPVARGRRTP